ncbi:hypothetical protein [Cobetia amphilecti]|uniref:hypothetical protein n=1 Tax=Cobetia amphilecti TaxID=1055104 RepID=UPI0032987EC2
MNTLRDMPMVTIEQKNRFREAALKVEAERDELAAQFSEMAALADSLTYASSEGEADEIVQKIAGLVHDEGGALARRDALIKAEALEELTSQPGMEHFTASRAAKALAAEYREKAATEAMDAIDGEDGDFANVRGVVERMIAAGYRKQAEGSGDE